MSSSPVDLTTTYLGFSLAHPLVPGASPLTDDLDTVKRLEDAGAAAIVMRSLFEEQITLEHLGRIRQLPVTEVAFPEVLTYFPDRQAFELRPDAYLEQLARIKAAVAIPVVASLNGHSAEGWLRYARWIEQAGADALELNVYFVATDLEESAAGIEHRVLDIARIVRETVAIPIAVKLSPFFSSIPHLAAELSRAGVDGLVLFNRFYQPDVDPDRRETSLQLHYSDSSELLLRLRWLAILSGRVNASLAVTGGVHTSLDALKAVMVGADAVQLVSALLIHGPGYLRTLHDGLVRWMEEHEQGSLADLRGCMSLKRCPDPGAFERGNYLRILQRGSG